MADILRLLLVEDSPSDAKLVIQELRKTWRAVETRRVDTPGAMRAALEEESWDAVTSDWSMPSFIAPAALSVLRAAGLDLPFIIVSGTIGEEVAVEAMRAGAHDYVLKDKLTRLGPAIERELRESDERAARRRAEVALRLSEARFRRLADSGIIGIVVADLSGAVLEVNDACLRMVGYSREEVVQGKVGWKDLAPPEFAWLGARAAEELKATGIAPLWQTEALRKDGTRITVLVGVALLEYPTFVAFVLDVSQRISSERESARLAVAAKREQVGRERAEHALRQSEEQLRQAQKMEAVGRLAGGVAHDFNNVLSVILSYVELISADLNVSDPLRGDIEEIGKAASRAAGLTRQLLLFSRQQVVEAKVLDLHDVLVAMDKMLQRVLGEDIELVCLPPKAAGCVKADPSHIEQVILNLVVNARDAMPTGGRLTIETSNVFLDETYAQSHLPSKAGPYVMLAVTDTGIGMDRETQARIFEPFFTTKGKDKGTGLGLSTVFGIVQQSGGSIWVYSEPGKGTTFKIYIPQVNAIPEPARAKTDSISLRGTETILVVEDEEQVRVIAVSILRRQGYQVIAAPHPGEALLASERYPGRIDLLVTDVVMPQMSGPELAKRLSITRPKMKVLCMSGYTDDSIVRHGVLEAGVGFVQKPITPASLSRKVREVLDAVEGT